MTFELVRDAVPAQLKQARPVMLDLASKEVIRGYEVLKTIPLLDNGEMRQSRSNGIVGYAETQLVDRVVGRWCDWVGIKGGLATERMLQREA